MLFPRTLAPAGILLALSTALSPLQAAPARTLPIRVAQTQLEMNERAAVDLKKADAALNNVYKKLMAATSGETREAIITAQLAWLKFRDANADAWAAPNKGGSIYPLIHLEARTRTTQARLQELQKLLEAAQR